MFVEAIPQSTVPTEVTTTTSHSVTQTSSPELPGVRPIVEPGKYLKCTMLKCEILCRLSQSYEIHSSSSCYFIILLSLKLHKSGLFTYSIHYMASITVALHTPTAPMQLCC